MNNKCINFKIRTKKGIKYYYCSNFKKLISYDVCKKCDNKEYKIYKTIKKRSYKLLKKEKIRYSIIYNNLSICANCGSNNCVEKNEVFEGSYRQKSIELGMVVPLCHKCHKEFHNNSKLNLYYKVMFQKEYIKYNTLEDFIKKFGQNYIYKQQKNKTL